MHSAKKTIPVTPDLKPVGTGKKKLNKATAKANEDVSKEYRKRDSREIKKNK